MVRTPNLARRPFVNDRPIKRTATLLAAAGLLLLLANLWLYVGYARTRTANASQLRAIEARIVTENERLAAAERALAAADLGLQNELVSYLNRRIDERSFGWSVLFDRLAALLPGDVRLNTLAPRFAAEESRRARRAGGDDPPPEAVVELSVQGTARDGEALLELVDALFADPAFRDPNLSQEAQTARGELAFNLTVSYLPEAADALAAAARAAAGDDGEGDEDEDGDGGGDEDDAEVTT